MNYGFKIGCIINRATAPILAEGSFGGQFGLLHTHVEEHQQICKNLLVPEATALSFHFEQVQH